MMLDSLRPSLYYLGFVANLLFGLRFFWQWIQSEKQGKSVVPTSFWMTSLLGNGLMALHGWIQLQFPICLIQVLNLAIAWRNLNLKSSRPAALKPFLWIMGAAVSGITLLFLLQNHSLGMRPPVLPWSGEQASSFSWVWHLLGILGMALFAIRFWVQWYLAEKGKKSVLGPSFWWLSCVGGSLSLLYFIRLHDVVNMIGYSLGLVPYIRNLMLLKPKASGVKQKRNESVYLFAGEQSGDLLGGHLVQALRNQAPSLSFFGVGGPEMGKAGMQITHPMDRFQVMGFSDVIKALPRLYFDFRAIKREILTKCPAAVVLIDYADFNLRLAKALRKGGYQGKLIHYVCPSVWAWRKNRVFSLAKTLDTLLSILPFEGACFSQTSLPVRYVGHPLVAALDHHSYDSNWKIEGKVIALFPGSRKHEIIANLPLQIEAAKLLGPEYTIAVSCARPQLHPLIESLIPEGIPIIPGDKRYELMRSACGALATSGTVILELGLHSVPTVATYKLSSFNYLLGRYLFRIHLRFYTLVNIICERQVYPEFIHRDLSAKEIAHALNEMVLSPDKCHSDCLYLRQVLDSRDASHEAALTIRELLA